MTSKVLEKSIKWLSNVNNFENVSRYSKEYFEHFNKVVKAVRIARDLVERNTPMLPVKLKWNNTENYYYICPKCEEMVAASFEVFCKKCGQRLDWGEKENEQRTFN